MISSRLVLLAVLGAVTWPAVGRNAPPRPMNPVHAGVLVVISGQVKDSVSGTPLPGVQVTVVGENLGTLTDTAGRFSLGVTDAWIGRSVTVRAALPGYQTGTRAARLASGTNVVDFFLRPQAVELDAIVQAGQPKASREEGRVILANLFAPDLAMRGIPGRYNPDFNTESYAHIQDNVFLAAATNPLSTFSIDVDRASYANVRRFIRDGVRPPIDAVRVEELINYFPYDDPVPEGDAPLSVRAEVGVAPWQPLHRLVRIALKGSPVNFEDAPPSNLVFLLDVSGSMNSPDKLPLLKTAFRMLVNELRPTDRVAIVVYAGAAGLVLPSTPGTEKETILEAIDQLNAGGSTAGGAGLKLAYEVAAKNHMAGGNNRVILATDGDFNVGVSSDSEMIRLVEDRRDQGTFLTVLGFGTGNLKDSKMEQIADHGNGNFSYIDSVLEARKVLVSEMGGTLVTIAKDVKLQVEFNPTRVAAYRLIGYENRLLAAEDFNDDTKDAGELGAGHSVTAFYEVIPVGVDSPVEVPVVDSLRYQATGNRTEVGDSDEILFVKLRYKKPDSDTSTLLDLPVMDDAGSASEDFRFGSAVAAWGMLLRGSQYCQGFSLQEVADLAKGALGEDPEGYRSEFVHLVQTARSMDLLEMEPGSSG